MPVEVRRRFVVAVQPFADESIDSFIARLAQANGYPSPNWVVAAIDPARGEPRGSLTVESDETFIERFAALARVDAALIRRMTAVRFAPLFALPRNEPSHSGAGRPTRTGPEQWRWLHRQNTKVCPLCIADGTPYHRLLWDIRMVTACLVHNVLLVDGCAHKGAEVDVSLPIAIRRSVPGQCGCLKTLASLPTHSVSAHELMAQRDIQARLAIDLATDSTRVASNAYFVGLERVWKLVQLSFRGRDSRAHARDGNPANATTHAQINAAWAIASDPDATGKRAMHDLLGRLHGRATDGQGLTGVRRDFGALVRFLGRYPDEPLLHQIRHAINKHLTQEWTGGYVKLFVPAVRAERDQRFVSLTDAKGILGLGGQAIETLVRTGKLAATTSKRGSRQMYLFDRADLDAFVATRTAWMSVGQAAHALTITEKLVHIAIEHGLLPDVGYGDVCIPMKAIGQSDESDHLLGGAVGAERR